MKKAVVIALGIWLTVYAILTFLTTIHSDQKFRDWKSRLQFSLMVFWAWPLALILFPFRILQGKLDDHFGWELQMRKRHAILWRLLGNHPNWHTTRDPESLEKRFVKDYLKKFYPEGIKLYKDKSVDLEMFEQWCENTVKIPVHESGLWSREGGE